MNKKGLIYAALASIAFGTSVIVNKIGLNNSNLTPLAYTTLSVIVAGAICTPNIVKRRRELHVVSKRSLWQILIVGLIASGLANFLLFLGQSMTTATNAGFIASLSSFFTIPFAFLLLNEKIAIKKYPFVILLLTGVYLLVAGGRKLEINTGDFLILGAALSWGFTNAFSKLPMKEVRGDLVAFLRLFIGGFTFLVISFFIFSRGLPVFEYKDYLVLVSGFLMWACIIYFYKAIYLLGATNATIALVTYPVVSTILAIIFLGESMTLLKFIGGLAILISTYKIIRK